MQNGGAAFTLVLMRPNQPLALTLQRRHLTPALNAWAARAYCTTARQIATQHGCMDNLTTKRNFTRVIDVLGLLFDMLSMGVSPNRHWQTSGRLLQELNVCTVARGRFSEQNLAHHGTAVANIARVMKDA